MEPADRLPVAYQAVMAGDLAAVMRIEREAMPQPFREAHIRHMWEAAPPYGWRILRRRDDPGAGDVLAYCCYLWDLGEAHILRLGCGSRVRGRRLGSWLMLNVLQELQTAHLRCVHLEVRKSNTPARRLYRRLGFREVGYRPRYYADREDALLLSLDMAPADRDAPQWERLRGRIQAELIRSWVAPGHDERRRDVA